MQWNRRLIERLALAVFFVPMLLAYPAHAKKQYPPVDPRLVDAVGKSFVPIVQAPDEVEIFRIMGTPEKPGSGKELLYVFPILRKAESRRGEDAANLGKLLLSSRIYDLPDPGSGMMKLCGFSPGIALRFWSGGAREKRKAIDFLICLQCNEIAVNDPKQGVAVGLKLHSDPGRDELLEMAANLFPEEATWRQLRAQDALMKSYDRQVDLELHPLLRKELLSRPPQATRKLKRITFDAPRAELVVSILRVLGLRAAQGYPFVDDERQLMLDAVAGIPAKDILAELTNLRHDKLALLGAAWLWFHDEPFDQLPPETRAPWPALLARVAIEEESRKDKLWVIFDLRREGSTPGVMDLLHRAARGELAERLDASKSLVRPVALLSLAHLNDATAKEELLRFTPRSELEEQIVDVARALLGEKERLKESAFTSHDDFLFRSALTAVHRFHGAVGMDWLVQQCLDRRWREQDRAVETFAELVKDQWTVPTATSGQQSREERTTAIQAWWSAHGEEFKKRAAQHQ